MWYFPRMPINRREFIFSSAGFIFQIGAAKDNLIVRSESPTDFETLFSCSTEAWITANDLHYVRTHLTTPKMDLNSWNLAVEGEVNRPLKLTINDIRGFREADRDGHAGMFGQRPGLFGSAGSRTAMGKGAVGTARWTGIPLRDVLNNAGVKATAKHIIMNGADVPAGAAPDFVRSIPIEKAMHPNTILAYKMNGEDIPLEHGFPVRLIVPGWEAAASTKWITNIRVSETEADGFFFKTAYRIPNRSVAPGTAVDPNEWFLTQRWM